MKASAFRARVASFLAFSPDGKTLATCRGGLAASVEFLDVMTGKNMASVSGVQLPRALSFSPDGKVLAVANSGNGRIELLEATSHKFSGAPLQKAGIVQSVA